MKNKITELVCDVIKRLRDRNGSTRKEILNYIMSEFKDTSPSVKKQVVAALQRGVDHGYLKRNNGHYSLSTEPPTDISPAERAAKLSCGPKKRRSRRRVSKGRSMCGAAKRKRSRCGRSRSRRKRRRSRGCKAKKRSSRSMCKPKRRRRRRRSKGLKCAPSSAEENQNYDVDEKIAKAKSPAKIEGIYEPEDKQPLGRSKSKHRAESKAPSKQGSRAPSRDEEQSRSSNWSNHDD